MQIWHHHLVPWVDVSVFNRTWLFMTPWTVAFQALPSNEFYRQEYWSRLPFPSPGYLPDPGIEPVSLVSPALQADTLLLCYLGRPKHWDTWFHSPFFVFCAGVTDYSPPRSVLFLSFATLMGDGSLLLVMRRVCKYRFVAGVGRHIVWI